MAFNPQQLPPTVYEIYKQKPANWILTVYTAIQLGFNDLSILTNIAFYIHHPELDGRPLYTDETTLIAEWKAFYTLVKPLVSGNKSSDKSTQNTTNDSLTEPVYRPRGGIVSIPDFYFRPDFRK